MASDPNPIAQGPWHAAQPEVTVIASVVLWPWHRHARVARNFIGCSREAKPSRADACFSCWTTLPRRPLQPSCPCLTASFMPWPAEHAEKRYQRALSLLPSASWIFLFLLRQCMGWLEASFSVLLPWVGPWAWKECIDRCRYRQRTAVTQQDSFAPAALALHSIQTLCFDRGGRTNAIGGSSSDRQNRGGSLETQWFVCRAVKLCRAERRAIPCETGLQRPLCTADPNFTFPTPLASPTRFFYCCRWAPSTRGPAPFSSSHSTDHTF